MTSSPLPSEFSMTTLALQMISLFFYALLWFRVRKLQRKSTSSAIPADRILKSLVVIFCIEFFGWATNMTISNVLKAFAVEALAQWHVMSIVGYIVQTSLSINAPVLFMMRLFFFSCSKSCRTNFHTQT